jgi:hypothetical protein
MKTLSGKKFVRVGSYVCWRNFAPVDVKTHIRSTPALKDRVLGRVIEDSLFPRLTA